MSYIKRRIRRGQPVRAPSEDSLSQHQTNLLANAGYDYHNGAWRPPRPPHIDTTLAKLRQRRLSR